MTEPSDIREIARRLNAESVSPGATRQVATVVRTAGACAVVRLGDLMLSRPAGARLLADGIRRRLAAGDDDHAVGEWLHGVARAQSGVELEPS